MMMLITIRLHTVSVRNARIAMMMMVMMMMTMMMMITTMMTMVNMYQSDELFLFTGHTMDSSSTEILTAAELTGIGALML